MSLKRFFLFALLPWAVSAQWSPQTSNTTASLRGISVVNAQTAWASGTAGTWLRTLDGGTTWQTGHVPDADKLDFRDIEAFSADHAILMSIGPGESSRIYRTTDGGSNWTMTFKNPEAQGFFDAIAFWDAKRGILMGDPVGGQLYAALTDDGGLTWHRVTMPPAREGEGAFAASGTCLTTGRNGKAWIVSGGTGGSRVYRSSDWGKTWAVSEAPIRHEKAASGIFSIAFFDDLTGVVTGGDYSAPKEDRDNFAVTMDGGKTWQAAPGPKGYRSAIQYVPGTKRLFAAGTTGVDESPDGGRTWKPAAEGNFNALGFASTGEGWAVGPKGVIWHFASR